MSTILIFTGLALLAIEVAVLGFAVMLLFFIGLGCLATGILMLIGILPSTLSAALLGTGILSLVSAAGLWKPLKRLQNNGKRKPVKSDLVGYSFVLDSDVTDSEPGKLRFSGIDWKVVAENSLSAGTEVEVVSTAVGELRVAEKPGLT